MVTVVSHALPCKHGYAAISTTGSAYVHLGRHLMSTAGTVHQQGKTFTRHNLTALVIQLSKHFFRLIVH